MNLTLSLVQMKVIPADPEANLRKAAALVATAAAAGARLVCLPEMWTTGFQWDQYPRLLQDQDSTQKRLSALARQHRLWINGSVLASDAQGRPANTSLLLDPDGACAGTYRKTHLFTLMNEQKYLAPGQSRCVVGTPWGKLGLTVCYDLRFPELFRAYALEGVELQLVPAGWPHPRLEHWRTLLRARAIENQMFVAACNQVGTEQIPDGGEATFCGHSAIIDPWGQVVVEAEEDERVLTAEIEVDQVHRVREKMTVLRDRRPELYL